MTQKQILQIINGHQDPLSATEQQLASAVRQTNQLRDTNAQLERHIEDLEANAQQQDSSDSSSASSAATHQAPPVPPIINPDTNALIQHLVDAQRQSNLLQEQGRQEELRARLRSVPVKFPSLKTLEQHAISTWYDSILPHLKKPKYSSFYDQTIGNVVPNGNFDPELNSILYDELMSPLAAPVKEYINSKPNLHGNGIVLLQDLLTTFNRPWTTLEKERHQIKWITLRQNRNESLQDFFNRCVAERKKSVAHGIPCSDLDLRHRFIMGLPAQFTSVQEQADDLPLKWRVNNIHQLPIVAQEFLDNKTSIRALHRKNKDTSTPSGNQTNSNNNNVPRQSQNNGPPNVSPAVQARRDDVYNSIMAGTFNVCSYLPHTPQGQCIYHFNAHPGGPNHVQLPGNSSLEPSVGGFTTFLSIPNWHRTTANPPSLLPSINHLLHNKKTIP